MRDIILIVAKYPLVKKVYECDYAITNFNLPQNVDYRSVSLCKSTIYTDLNDFSMVRNIASTMHPNSSVVGAYSQNELGLLPAAKINETNDYSVNFNSIQSTLNARNKATFRSIVPLNSAADSYGVFHSRDQIREFLTTHVGSPIILKPIAGVGSAGVQLLREKEEVDHLEVPDEGLIAEIFVTGQQYSVETFSFDGTHKFICINREINNIDSVINPFIQIGHCLPVSLSERLHAIIQGRVFAALSSLGVKHGPCHTEIMLDDENVSIIEVNTRPGSSPIPDLIQEVTGVDLYDLAFNWFRRQCSPREFSVPLGVGAAVRHFNPPPGRLKAVHGVQAALSMSGVLSVAIKVSPGALISPLRSAFDRVGHVTARGYSAEEAFRICTAAAGLICFEVE